MTNFPWLALRDAVETARRNGIEGEWIGVVERRLTSGAPMPPLPLPSPMASVATELRRRLDYVLGGLDRPPPRRILQRVLRTLRGATGPRDLSALTAPIPAQPNLPSGQAVRANFVLTGQGRRMYVDPEDRRGAALIDAKGELRPSSLVIWRKLVAEQDWTDIVDVGANYGEMLIGVDLPAGARVIAVEPNPHVGWYLDRTLQEAGLKVDVVRKAVGDRAGAVDLMINRTWSGMSAIAIDRKNTAGHRFEPIRVDAVTLHDLLAGAANPARRRVLVKIDIEGHEASALRGLAGIDKEFGAFAALVEITQLSSEDIAWLLERYTIELLDPVKGELVSAAVSTPGDLKQLLARGMCYTIDAVLRRR